MTTDEKYEAKKLRDKLRMREWRKANPEENKRRAKASRNNETSERRKTRLDRLKKWKAENKEHVKQYQKDWREKNRKAVAEYQKEYSKKYREKKGPRFQYWRRNLRDNYNLTVDEWNDLWQLQNGKCAICNINMNPRGRAKQSVAVDHNHKTGEVRGLLCRSCNHSLGDFKDDPDILISAAEYLIERGYCGSSDKDEKT